MKGYGEYPEDWEAIANAVKDSVGWRCARCNHPGARWIPDTENAEQVAAVLLEKLGQFQRSYRIRYVEDGAYLIAVWVPCDGCLHVPDQKQRVLTVHHLDGNKGNSAWWNLCPLCQVCHLQIQSVVVMDQSYLWKHSPWFRPYAAGYYASQYLKQDLSRPEVETRLEELLALGQPHLYPDSVSRETN